MTRSLVRLAVLLLLLVTPRAVRAADSGAPDAPPSIDLPDRESAVAPALSPGDTPRDLERWGSTRRVYFTGIALALAGPALFIGGYAAMNSCSRDRNCGGWGAISRIGEVAWASGPIVANLGALANARVLKRAGLALDQGYGLAGLVVAGVGTAALVAGAVALYSGRLNDWDQLTPFVYVWLLSTPTATLLAVGQMIANRHAAVPHARVPARASQGLLALVPAPVGRSPGVVAVARF